MPNSGNIATISGNLVTNSGIDLSTKADLVNGLVPSTQLPSYVDDVLEYANLAGLPGTGEVGKIYVTLDNNKIYRWSGSVYIEISPSPGSTDSVAEGSTNLYFTNARARAALSFIAGSGGYNSTTGVITIPTNTNQLTNGAGFITSYTETDTLATVTGRGATTTTQVILSGGLRMGTATLNPSGDGTHFHFNGTAIIPNSTTTASNANMGTAAYRWNNIYGGGLDLSGSATITANVTAQRFIVGSVLGTSPFEINRGSNESQVLIKKTSQSAFSILTWDNNIFLTSNIYYSAGTWIHSAPSGNNNNQLFVFVPGTGITWYASNNGSGSWNVSNNITLWNDSGVWQRPVSSVSGTTNYISKFTSSTAVGNSQIFDNGTLIGIGTTSAYIDSNDKFIIAGGRFAVNALAYSAGSFNRSTAGHVVDVLIGGYGKGALSSDGTNFNLLAYADLILSSGSSERVRITSTGDVGIGVSAPSTKLEVRRVETVSRTVYTDILTINADATTNPYSGYGGGILFKGETYRGDYSWGRIGMILNDHSVSTAGESMIFEVAAADNSNTLTRAMTIQYDGNIGIGTSAPVVKLQVHGTGASYASQSDILAVFKETGTNKNGYILIDNATASYDTGIRLATNGVVQWTIVNGKSISPNALWFYDNVSSLTRLAITSSGNVGIGTTNPQTGVIFDARGAVAIAGGTEGLRIGSVGDNSSYDNVKIYYTGYNSAAPRVYLTPRTTPGSGIVESFFHIQNSNGASTTSNNTMGLLVDGSVGIGTTAPTQKLSVIGNTYVSGRLSVATTSTAGSGITVGGSTILLSFAEIQQGNVFYFYSAGNTSITQLSQNGTNFYINATGNVGISTTNPAHKLDVVGGINSDSYISLSNTLATTTNNYLYRVGTSLYWKRNRLRSYIERTIPSVSTATADYNKYYEIGSFAFSSLEGVFEIDLTFNGSGYGQGSRHIVPVSYAMDYLTQYSTGLTAINGAGVWLVLDAVSQTPRHLMSNAANWELQMNVNNNTVQFRIVIKGGTAGTATAYIKITHNNDFDNCTYTELTGTGTDATTYSRLPAIMSGINGTSLIQNDLDVIGKLAVGTINPGNYKVYINGGQFGTLLKGGDLGVGSDVVRMLKSDDSIAMIVRGDGNVGIGTTSPSYKLDVVGSIRIPNSNYLYINNAAGTAAQILTVDTGDNTILNTPASGDIYLRSNGTTIARIINNGDVNLGGTTATSTPVVKITNGGNVGIGTTTPGAYINGGTAKGLQISNAGKAGIRFNDTGGVVRNFDIGIDGGEAFISAVYSQTATIRYQAYSTHLFETNSTEQMRITSTGNVGIGTNNPSSKLHVTGATDSNPTLSIGTINANTGNARIDLYSGTAGSNNSFSIRYNKTSSIDRIGFIDGGGIESFVIVNGGKVGIGLTNPDAILDVSHTAGTANIIRVSNGAGLYRWRVDQFFNMYMTNASGVDTFSVTTAGVLTATSITETSTIRIKENIAPLTAALEKVDQLQPVSYNKKGSTTKEIGLIAEDVFDIYPEFVLCDDNGEPMGIHYSRLTAVLIESVKELKKEITELKNRN